MELNRNIVQARVEEKLTKACLSAIVTECFMKALPLTQSEVAQESAKYGAYVTQVMNALHSETMLKKALESNADNAAAMKYLNRLNDVVVSTVRPAAIRIAAEAAASHNNNLKDVVDNAALTEDEMKKFIAKGNDLSTSDVAEVIKEKVVDTIKSEKQAYDENEALQKDIVQTLAETVEKSDIEKKMDEVDNQPQDDTTLESWMDLHLGKNDPRHPVTFFSRLQDVCIENLMATESVAELEDCDNISLESLLNVTIYKTLDCFDHNRISLDMTIDQLQKVCESLGEDSIDENKAACAADKSLVMTIIITTIMETLKTLRLFCPDMADIRKFVDTPVNIERGNGDMKAIITGRVNEIVTEMKRLGRNPQYNQAEMTEVVEAASRLRSRLGEFDEKALENKNELIKTLEDTCATLESKLAQENATDVLPTDSKTTHAREVNVASLDKMNRILFRHPATESAKLFCSSDIDLKDGGIGLEAVGYDANGNETTRVTLAIEMVPAFESVASELHNAAKFSKCADNSKIIELYFTDKCYGVPLVQK